MKPVDKSFTFKYIIHDSWTETLAGAHYLLSDFEESNKVCDKAHLCRLVLISANHLIEKLFFDLAEEALKNQNNTPAEIYNNFEKTTLFTAMRKWPQLLVHGSAPLSFDVEPLLSADELRKQRNRSIHKESEMVTFEMAKKALYSAVETCRVIWKHFHKNKAFKYECILEKYPVMDEGHYSTATNINNVT